MNLQKHNSLNSKVIRHVAKGENCTLNSPDCNYDPSTTVFCHLNEYFAGKGIGKKAVDIGFFGCSDCHILYDRNRLKDEYFYLLRAVIRTWLRLIDLGILKMK